ncbi:MAG: alpha/beta hydrolase [Leptospirales bacterium]
MKSIFKNEAAKVKLLEWYEKFKKKIKHPLESRLVETSFGETHVLVGGPKNGQPLVLLHGALASSAHVLSEVTSLMDNFRVYSVDIIGQSPKSADNRLSVKNNDYGKLMVEVLDELKLDKPNVVAVSWGGFVAIRTAVHAPERINKLVLLVPAGMVNGPAWAGLTKLAFPMYLYKKNPSAERLKNFAKNLLTTLDDDWMPYIGEAFLSFNMNMQVPKLAKKNELENFNSPTFVVGADMDLSFPGEKVLSKANEIFPNLKHTQLLENSKHSPPTTDEFRTWLSEQIKTFLETTQV